jgi:hypothetical protein
MGETVPFGDTFAASVHGAAARLYPDHNPYAGYLQDGSELFVAVNVTAGDAKAAERAGAQILTARLPSSITVVSVEARPLLLSRTSHRRPRPLDPGWSSGSTTARWLRLVGCEPLVGAMLALDAGRT